MQQFKVKVISVNFNLTDSSTFRKGVILEILDLEDKHLIGDFIVQPDLVILDSDDWLNCNTKAWHYRWDRKKNARPPKKWKEEYWQVVYVCQAALKERSLKPLTIFEDRSFPIDGDSLHLFKGDLNGVAPSGDEKLPTDGSNVIPFDRT